MIDFRLNMLAGIALVLIFAGIVGVIVIYGAYVLPYLFIIVALLIIYIL